MRHASEHWLVPDWRDATAYLPPWASPRFFAWEFLRRNPSYRTAWLQRREVLLGAGYPSDWVPGRANGPELDIHAPAELWTLEPPSLRGETLYEYEVRIGEGVEYRMRWAGHAAAQAWGYSAGDLIDPNRSGWSLETKGERTALSMDGDIMLAFGIGTGPSIHDGKDAKPSRTDGALVVYFDGLAPIEDQLKKARRLLSYEQVRLSQKGLNVVEQPPKDAPTAIHLRILDALSSAACIPEIARVLYPNDAGDAIKKAYGERKKALRWRDEGWCRLMLVTENRRNR